MDQVAAQAAVSKQTVYKHFGEKRELLFAIVTDALDTSVAAIRNHIDRLPESTDLEADLVTLAEVVKNYVRAGVNVFLAGYRPASR